MGHVFAKVSRISGLRAFVKGLRNGLYDLACLTFAEPMPGQGSFFERFVYIKPRLPLQRCPNLGLRHESCLSLIKTILRKT